MITTAALCPVVLRSGQRGLLGASWRGDWPVVLAIAVLSALAYVLVLVAMRSAAVSSMAPLRESLVLGALAGWLIFGEPQPVRRVCGSLIALAGIIAIAW